MTSPTEPAPYGAWPSPITAAEVAAHRLRVSDLQTDGADVYWIEGRPEEAGRCVIVRLRDGERRDLIAAPWSARTWVHEYGGGAVRASGGVVCFSNAADRRLYVLDDDAPRALSPASGDIRFADMDVDAARGRVVCVAEDHRGDGVVNDIRAVPLSGGEPLILVSGNDFYSSPRVSPDGTRMCWLTWNNPSMPWDDTELWVADLDDAGMPVNARRVSGGPGESVVQPEWSPQGVLHLVSDRTGWWNLYRLSEGALEPLAPLDADCGHPAWTFRRSTYAFLGGDRIALSACFNGMWRLGVVAHGEWTPFDLPFTDFGGQVAGAGDRIVVCAGGPREAPAIVSIDSGSGAVEVITRVDAVRIPSPLISAAEPVTFEGWNGAAAHGFLYSPHNPAVRAPDGERPPLYVHAHGGPTSACSPALDPLVQYWTSRGFAFFDVNYGGSTGYGRAYRQRLVGEQGVVDVGDCVRGALHLAHQGLVDPERMVIEGGSAGGYIVLCAMTFYDVFAAGISLFGIADLELLLEDTHKFEARYFDSMVGPLPEARALYRERSPVHFVDRVRRAVFLLQGLDDPIVPANQAEVMHAALVRGGVPCAYIGFPGEQHGFRQAANIARTLEAELYFLGRVLGFTPAEDIEPVDIANLEAITT